MANILITDELGNKFFSLIMYNLGTDSYKHELIVSPALSTKHFLSCRGGGVSITL